jgi:hypothetical protein
MLEGELVRRLPDGEHRLSRGDIVTFPAGGDGARTVTNRGSNAAQIVMFSSGRTPAVAVYPDSDKIAVWPGIPGLPTSTNRRPSSDTTLPLVVSGSGDRSRGHCSFAVAIPRPAHFLSLGALDDAEW